MKSKENYYLQELSNIKYGWNEYYGKSYLTPINHSKATSLLSKIRADKVLNYDDWSILKKIYDIYLNKYFEVKELIHQEPRRHAQLFIGRKKIREFIFKRDNYKCLCCGSLDNLSIDHIVAINKKGENKISNLQTLCRSCNSRKSDKYKDYR